MIQGSHDVEQKILQRVVPDKNERFLLETTIADLTKTIQKLLQDIDIPITIELVGSTAKDTYLSTTLDIDLFICFPCSTSREQLETIGLSIGKKVLEKQEECFAEHPYLRGEFNGYKTEIVPCYRLESVSQKLSAVDRTPFHTRYIKQHLSESQKNEVRLLKQFLIGIGCYGAEAEVEGFSGYLCEILILKYDSFQNLLLHAQHWEYGIQLVLHAGQIPCFDTPLIFIDPVDSERNVASALSKEKFDLFIRACGQYCKNPKTTFFFPNELKTWSLDKIKSEIGEKKFLGLQIKKPDIIAENLYPQVRKALRSVVDLCNQYGFTIIDSFFFLDSHWIYLVLLPKERKIPELSIHRGPPISLKQNADDFVKKWLQNPRTLKKPYEKNGRLYVHIRREYVDIIELMKEQLNNISLGKHLDMMVNKQFFILEHNDLVIEQLRMLWTDYLDSLMPWER